MIVFSTKLTADELATMRAYCRRCNRVWSVSECVVNVNDVVRCTRCKQPELRLDSVTPPPAHHLEPGRN
jgi:hypothetical protein